MILPLTARPPLPKQRSKPRRFGMAAQIEESLGRRRLPQRDKERLAWLRRQPCALCRLYGLKQTTPTEAAHTGPHGLSTKASDTDALPLCREHHRTRPDSAHVLGRNFARYHGLEKRR